MDQNQISRESPGDALVDAIKGELKSLSSISTGCCIYRVPRRLRKLIPEAYSPRVISIGPFHHGKEEFQGMEEHKLRYLQSFIPRTRISLEELVKVVRTWEEKARSCYAETLNLSSDEFVKMLIVDGSFMVEFLLRSHYPQLIGENDRIFRKPRMIDDVCRDMVLLENQLPFFVVKGMFDLLAEYYQQRIPPVIEIVHHHFRCFLSINGFLEEILSSDIEHFVDLLRSYYLPLVPQKTGKDITKLESPRGATELQNAGVKFKLRRIGNSSLDISFTNGVLVIPCVEIDDLTETLYRNIIAFEQCHFFEKYFTHYALLLSSLIKSPQDADLLVKHRIIMNRLGNGEDVSRLFNGICKEVVFGGGFYFQDLSENLNAYCNTAWNKWKATLRRDYFHNPWSVASVLAALLLLLLTFIQAICSILAL